MIMEDIFRVFIMFIFYVGKGKCLRLYVYFNEVFNFVKVRDKWMMFNIKGDGEFCLFG